MNIITKAIIIFIAVYVIVGCVFATKWAINYNQNENSIPNNGITFIINVATWPF